MNKVILHGLALLLFCVVARSLRCNEMCSDEECTDNSCQASPEDECFSSTITEIPRSEDDTNDTRLSFTDLLKTGCTTEENRDRCNTTYPGILSDFLLDFFFGGVYPLNHSLQFSVIF
uniref:Uncharacterized protein n=1 Tax=Sphaerodactylus townsendi TaxID=933632 RepID=A0ACB8EGN0_9SAUR